MDRNNQKERNGKKKETIEINKDRLKERNEENNEKSKNERSTKTNK